MDFLNRDKFVVSIQQARYKEIPSNYRKLDAAQIKEINHDPQLSPVRVPPGTGHTPSVCSALRVICGR